jgi:uncharacterized protein YjbI with pentapeptide repeats
LYSSNLDKIEILKLQKDIISIEKDKMIAANGISASIIPMMGVIGLAITSYIGYKNFRVAEDKQVTECFSKAISSKAIFWNAYLIRANLQKANLSGTNFHNAKLVDAYLYKTDFTNAMVNRVDFSNASMREANFTQANLNDSLFKKVYLWQADFTDALPIDTDFISTNIDAAKNLAKDQLKYARINNQERVSCW